MSEMNDDDKLGALQWSAAIALTFLSILLGVVLLFSGATLAARLIADWLAGF